MEMEKGSSYREFELPGVRRKSREKGKNSFCCTVNILITFNRGGSRIFFRRGCTRVLLYFNTNKPHSFFFGRIPVVSENRRSCRGGDAHPLHPPPRSAPEILDSNFYFLILFYTLHDIITPEAENHHLYVPCLRQKQGGTFPLSFLSQDVVEKQTI